MDEETRAKLPAEDAEIVSTVPKIVKGKLPEDLVVRYAPVLLCGIFVPWVQNRQLNPLLMRLLEILVYISA